MTDFEKFKQDALEQLRLLEKTKGCKVVYAAVVGDRIKDIHNKNTSWDIRFIYTYPITEYISVSNVPNLLFLENMPHSWGMELRDWLRERALRCSPDAFELINSPMPIILDAKKGLYDLLNNYANMKLVADTLMWHAVDKFEAAMEDAEDDQERLRYYANALHDVVLADELFDNRGDLSTCHYPKLGTMTDERILASLCNFKPNLQNAVLNIFKAVREVSTPNNAKSLINAIRPLKKYVTNYVASKECAPSMNLNFPSKNVEAVWAESVFQTTISYATSTELMSYAHHLKVAYNNLIGLANNIDFIPAKYAIKEIAHDICKVKTNEELEAIMTNKVTPISDIHYEVLVLGRDYKFAAICKKHIRKLVSTLLLFRIVMNASYLSDLIGTRRMKRYLNNILQYE